MVLTAVQTAAFFTANDQMAIPRVTVAQLANEGIEQVTDLINFNKLRFSRLQTTSKVQEAVFPIPMQVPQVVLRWGRRSQFCLSCFVPSLRSLFWLLVRL